MDFYVWCAECGKELSIDVAAPAHNSSTYNVDARPCKKCTDRTEQEHSNEVTRLEKIIDGMQTDIDTNLKEIEYLHENYEERLSKLNAIVEAMKTCE